MLELKLRINGADFVCSDNVGLADSLFREGRFDDARDVLRDEINAGEGAAILEAALLLAKVEHAAKRPRAALRVLSDYQPHFDAAGDRLRAWFHMTRAATYHLAADSDPTYIDRAFLDYEQGIDFQKKSGETAEAGCAENNLALLLARFGRFDDAHEHFRRARSLFAGLPVKLAEVDETTARVLILEGKFYEAEGYALEAVSVFRRYDERRLLNEARRTLAFVVMKCAEEA